MSSIIESVMDMLSGETLGKVSQQVGAPAEKTQQALPDILAVLTGALAKNSSQTQGAKELSNALARDHDGSVLNNLSDYINNYKSGEGDGILEHVLGKNRDTVEKSLGKKSGLDASTIDNLFKMAAPLIMGVLGKTQKKEGFNIGSLTNLLGAEKNRAQNIAPDAMDILSKILKPDSNSSQNTQPADTPAKKRSPVLTIVILIILAVILYFILRSCSIL